MVRFTGTGTLATSTVQTATLKFAYGGTRTDTAITAARASIPFAIYDTDTTELVISPGGTSNSFLEPSKALSFGLKTKILFKSGVQYDIPVEAGRRRVTLGVEREQVSRIAIEHPGLDLHEDWVVLGESCMVFVDDLAGTLPPPVAGGCLPVTADLRDRCERESRSA